MFSTLRSSVVDPKLFFSDPDPIFRRVLDPDSDPSWLVKSFGSSFGSRVSISLFFCFAKHETMRNKKIVSRNFTCFAKQKNSEISFRFVSSKVKFRLVL
jgi:hypothetical protein